MWVLSPAWKCVCFLLEKYNLRTKVPFYNISLEQLVHIHCFTDVYKYFNPSFRYSLDKILLRMEMKTTSFLHEIKVWYILKFLANIFTDPWVWKGLFLVLSWDGYWLNFLSHDTIFRFMDVYTDRIISFSIYMRFSCDFIDIECLRKCGISLPHWFYTGMAFEFLKSCHYVLDHSFLLSISFRYNISMWWVFIHLYS